MTKKQKAFLILYTRDPYFSAIHSQLLLELSKIYPDHLLLISPVWSISFYNSFSFSPIAFLKYFKRYLSCVLSQFALESNVKRSIVSFLGSELPRNIKTIGLIEYLITSLSPGCSADARKAFLEEKENYVIKNIKVGDLIIDTFLRFKPSPSFQQNHTFCIALLKLARAYINYFNNLLNRYDVRGVFGSYTTYLYHGIPLRLAQSRGIDVITFGGRSTFYKHHTPSSFLSHHGDHTVFSSQSSLCNKLSSEAFEEAKLSLENRIHGRQDATISYMNKFSDSADSTYSVADNYVIFLHDFYDSPHIYRWMLHIDFYEWLNDTIKTLSNSGKKIFIKPHPNQSDDSSGVVSYLKDFYANNVLVFWISDKVCNSAILKQSPKLIISVYGSVLVEAAYCGVRSISAGDHPAVNFNISYNPASLTDYREKLANPSLIPPPSKEEAIVFLAQQRSVYSVGTTTSLINHLDCSWDHLNSNPHILRSTSVKLFIYNSIARLLNSHSF